MLCYMLPSVSSSLQVTNRSFASPYLWNQLPSSFRQPHSVRSPLGSPHPTHITSSQSSPSPSLSITPSAFHSRLKTHLFHKSFPPVLIGSFQTTFTDLEPVLTEQSGHWRLFFFCFWLRVLQIKLIHVTFLLYRILSLLSNHVDGDQIPLRWVTQ